MGSAHRTKGTKAGRCGEGVSVRETEPRTLDGLLQTQWRGCAGAEINRAKDISRGNPDPDQGADHRGEKADQQMRAQDPLAPGKRKGWCERIGRGR